MLVNLILVGQVKMVHYKNFKKGFRKWSHQIWSCFLLGRLIGVLKVWISQKLKRADHIGKLRDSNL